MNENENPDGEISSKEGDLYSSPDEALSLSLVHASPDGNSL